MGCCSNQSTGQQTRSCRALLLTMGTTIRAPNDEIVSDGGGTTNSPYTVRWHSVLAPKKLPTSMAEQHDIPHLCAKQTLTKAQLPTKVPISEKTFPEIFSTKKKPTYIKMCDYEHVRGLPGRPPRVRTSQTRNNSSSSTCCSNLLKLHFVQKCSNMLFELVPIANVPNKC